MKQTGIWTLLVSPTSTWKNLSLFVIFLFLPCSEKARKVPAPLFWGDDKVVIDTTDSVSLDWYVEPGNTTVSWVRCYQGNGRDPRNHFFSHHFHSGRQFVGGPLKGRTVICPFKNRDDAPSVIRILLKGPTKSDTGCFTCEIDVGGSYPLEAKLMLRVYASGTDEVLTVSQNIYIPRTTAWAMTENIDSGELDRGLTALEIGLLCGLGALVLITVIGFVYVRKFFAPREEKKNYSSVLVGRSIAC